MDLLKDIKQYSPVNEQEEKDKIFIEKFVEKNEDAFLRTNRFAHMTASAWVVNRNRDRILMAYHNIYHSWSWLGGHADGNMNLKEVALKEVREESGIETLKLVSDRIFSLEVLTVDGHEKRGEYVSSHLHLNVTYLIEADDSENVKVKEDENSAVAWFPIDEVISKSSEPWFQERIYKKLNNKLLNEKW